MTIPRDLRSLSCILSAEGPASALAYLNADVPHRYSAIYRLAGSMLKNVLLHDKEARVRAEYLTALPLEQSFCQFIGRDGSFRTDEAAADARLRGRSYPTIVASFHGLGLMTATGQLWGTLSHFDTVPLRLPDEEFKLLKGSARLFARCLIERSRVDEWAD
jgi:hypothetical protein